MTGGNSGRSQVGGQRRLGEFVLIEEIGRGGMGVVYRARQESLGRIVAVKILPSFAGLDPDAVARFRREAESAGRISHRGIVPVYAVGEDQGTYFYAMELVDGPSLEAMLAELTDRNPGRLLGSLAEETSLKDRCPGFLDARFDRASTGARYAVSCAAIIADLANALAMAHHAQVIHRDLKPSNVLLRKDGRPMLVDFGLSRDQTAVGLTMSGDAVGTPSYMAPEQAFGQKDLDARVDIYGLGATLYEMLTLRPPFDGGTAVEIMRQIVEDEPPSVRSLNSRVAQDLATIVHKCLAKNREHRYPVMEAVEHDLRAFLAGRPIGAQAPSLWVRGFSLATRHRRGIGVAAATTFVLSLAGVGVGFWVDTRAHDDGKQMLATARNDLVERADLDTALAGYARAEQLLRDPALLRSTRREHLAAAVERHYSAADKREWLERLLQTVPESVRDAEWNVLWRRVRGEANCTLVGHLLDAETTMVLSRLVGERFEPVAQGWPSNGMLETGPYMLRVERVGLATASVAFIVERDTTLQILVPQLNVAALGDDELLVASAAAPESPFVLSRTELSGAAWQRLRSGLSPEQAAELAGVQFESGEHPIRNVSFRQARTLAALAGGHLPTMDEIVLAARGHAPASVLPYPWGATLVGDKVSADPVNSTQTDAVDARPEGASVFGALNLVGNVAEVLSVGNDGVARAHGGDHLSNAEHVRIGATEVLAGFDAPGPRVGVRVARFVNSTRDVDVGASTAVSTRFEALWQEGGVVVLNDWEIDEFGAARNRLRMANFLLSQRRELSIPWSTPGFLQDGKASIRVGNADVSANRVLTNDGESSSLSVPTAAIAAGQLFRVDASIELTPLSGLRGHADSYVLQIPLKATGTVPTCYRVTLPKASRVDEVDPPPTHQFQQGQRQVLVWEFGVDHRGERTFSGVVRFRKDGFLTRRWPTKAEALAAVEQFFAAVHAMDVVTLRQLLAPTFLMIPSNLGVERMLDIDRPVRDQFTNVRFVDVTAVGSVLTTDLIVDWRVTDASGGRQTLNWPMRVHWRQVDGHAQILQVAPAAGGDTGRLDQGTYVHDKLLVRVDPRAGSAAPGQEFTLSRTVSHLAAMQVELRPKEAPFLVMLLGTFADGEVEASAMWQRLSDGVQLAGGAARLMDVKDDTLRKHAVRREDWQFGGEGRFLRERWLKVRSGRRWILLRLVAVGATAAEANSQWRAAEGWFKSVLDRVQIE